MPHVVCVGRLSGFDDLVVGRARLSVGDVVPDRPGEQYGFLHHKKDGGGKEGNIFFFFK